MTQALKLISRPGSERIVRYAFEYARRNDRKKVTCFTKDNILKLTDGLFHRVFEEIAKEYPDIEHEHWIVDIGSAKLADTPEAFDVLVLPNLYGDILSDVAAQLTGSVGLAGSANIGEVCSMFEAIHGSAPRRAGQNVANPSGLMLGAIMMLVHIGQTDVAERFHNAWLRTIEDGVHTYDIYREGTSKQKVGTKEFAQAVIARLGQKPQHLKHATYKDVAPKQSGAFKAIASDSRTKAMIGVDVYLDWNKGTPDQLGAALAPIGGNDLTLRAILNRGTRVWPKGLPETLVIDQWRCRFTAKNDGPVSHDQIVALLKRIADAGFDFVQTEALCTFDGVPQFSGIPGE